MLLVLTQKQLERVVGDRNPDHSARPATAVIALAASLQQARDAGNLPESQGLEQHGLTLVTLTRVRDFPDDFGELRVFQQYVLEPLRING